MQFHGAPDTAHDWVSTGKSNFEAYMHYLATHQFKVIALRDLQRYKGSDREPADPMAIIRARQRMLSEKAE